ncbi:hypothetical protein RSAG8_10535, partial [Rhizoctonia solani AG-8 WAC10335]
MGMLSYSVSHSPDHRCISSSGTSPICLESVKTCRRVQGKNVGSNGERIG